MTYNRFSFLLLGFAFFMACKNEPKKLSDTVKRTPFGEGVVSTKTEDPVPPPVVTPIENKPVWNFTVMPKQQVGDITSATSEADLKRIYGATNVQRVDRGAVQTVVFPKGEDEMEIAWRKGQTFKKIESIIIRKGKWQTPEGIRIGSSLKDLENANGKSVQLAPISDEEMRPLWQGGKVHPQLVIGFDPNAGRVFMMQINF